MEKPLYLSKKHGVNASLMICFFCEESLGVALLGKLKDDKEAPREGIYGYEPCDTCKDNFKKGILLVGGGDKPYQDNQPSMSENPLFYPNGGYIVVREEAIRRWFDAETAEQTIKMRKAFVPVEFITNILNQVEGDDDER